MKKLTLIQLSIIFIAGLIPLLWFKQGLLFSNADDFPPFINPSKAFSSGTEMWSPDYLGYATSMPSILIYQYVGSVLSYSGVSIGLIQVLFQVLLYMGAGFSIYFFSRTIYPDHKWAPFFSAFFYMFNLFVLQSRLNLGFAWTYTFLPLLLALFVRIVKATYREDRKAANVGIICFSLVSVVALSVASVNPINIALIFFSLSVLSVYFLVVYRKNIRPLAFSIAKIVAAVVPLNLWWVLPMLNAFVFSPDILNSKVSIGAWIWTHERSSFLNLFRFNGVWAWRPEYITYFSFYLNPIIIILMFVPFIVAGLSLLFKSKWSGFNAYVMFFILSFIFLAKGLHEPLREVNLWLYQYIPGMNMFREPASKFTLLIIPFLALLIGFVCDSIANLKVKFKTNRRIIKISILSFLLLTFTISSIPIFTNAVETKTEKLPFSSYIQVPQYWFEAADWINAQPGDWKVLLTPLNDFYQMPYEWGYYGADQFFDWFFDKPVVSADVLDGYVVNPSSAAILQLKTSVKFNRTGEFKALLDLLNIRYIVQRNDVLVNVRWRDLMSPVEMEVFFGNQPYLKLVKSFGELDIYEYVESKPSLYMFSPSSLQEMDIRIDSTIVLDKIWNFSFKEDIEEWRRSTPSSQSQAVCTIVQNRTYLRADMWNVTSGWITVVSPLLPAVYESSYLLKAVVAGDNTSQVNIKIAEYSSDMTLLTNSSMVPVNDGDFDWISVPLNIKLKDPSTKFFRIEIWNYFNASYPPPSSIWLDNVQVISVISHLNTTGFENLFKQRLEKDGATILNIQNISPVKKLVRVNATEPFVLATSQVLDRFWVAYMNGERVKPMPLFLGLKGFLINSTGEFDITIEYEPQLWFYYASVMSLSTLAVLSLFYLCIIRSTIKDALRKHYRAKSID